jgi:hypothetical protein
MKKAIVFIIIAVLFAVPDFASAQRALPGMRGLQVTGGWASGSSAFYTGVEMTTYAKSANKWMIGVEYLQKQYPYRFTYLPMAQFTADGGYLLNFLSDRSKTLFFSLGASALAGYETVNWGEKLLFDGATLNNRDAFIYGGAATLEMETYLTNWAVLLVHVRERLTLGSSVGKFHTQAGIGIKIIIN